MRHELPPGPIAPGAGRMCKSSTAGTLIALSGFAHAVAACAGGAFAAVSVTTVTLAADEDLRPTTGAQIQATCRRLHWRFPWNAKETGPVRSTGRASNAILAAHTALRPARRPATWKPCGGAVPDWTWQLRPASRLLFFLGKRLSTMSLPRRDAGRVSSRPTGSLRRDLYRRHTAHSALTPSTISIVCSLPRRRYKTTPEKR